MVLLLVLAALSADPDCRGGLCVASVFRRWQPGQTDLVELLGVKKGAFQCDLTGTRGVSGRFRSRVQNTSLVIHPMVGVVYDLLDGIVGPADISDHGHTLHRNRTHIVTWNRFYNRQTVQRRPKPKDLLGTGAGGAEIVLDKAVSLVHRFGLFFQHFLMNDLPRLALACPFLLSPAGRDAKLIVIKQRDVPLVALVCPIPVDRIVVAGNKWIAARHLYIPEWQYEGDVELGSVTDFRLGGKFTGEHLRKGNSPSRSAMAMYPPNIVAPVGKKKGKKAVWVSRGTGGVPRAVKNEVQVLSALEKALSSEGWSLEVFPHGKHPEGVIAAGRMFDDAAVLVGPHGGSFAMMLFLPRGAVIVEIQSSRIPNICWYGFSLTLGLEYRLVQAVSPGSPFFGPMKVDPSRVISALPGFKSPAVDFSENGVKAVFKPDALNTTQGCSCPATNGAVFCRS